MRVSSFLPNIVAKITAIQLQLSELIRIELTQKWGQLDWDGKNLNKSYESFAKNKPYNPPIKPYLDGLGCTFQHPYFSKEEDKLNRGDNVKKENNNIEKY